MAKEPADRLSTLNDNLLDQVTGGWVPPGLIIATNPHAFPDGPQPPNLDDTIVSTDRANVINAGGGADGIVTGDYQDFIHAGEGADSVLAGGGDDVIRGEQGADLLFGERGNDLFLWRSGDGADTIVGGQGTDTLGLTLNAQVSLEDVFAGLQMAPGGSARIEGDRIVLEGEAATLTVEGTRLSLFQIEYIQLTVESLEGFAGNDIRTGHDRAQILTGEGGDDTLEGAGGQDTIAAGAGDDVIVWSPGDGNDWVSGGDGRDTLLLNLPISYPLEQVLAGIEMAEGGPRPTIVGDQISLQGAGTLTIGGETIQFSGIESIRLSPVAAGTAERDLILGRSIGEAITGEAGNDTLIGQGGADRIEGDAGSDLIIWSSGDGSDTIDGGTGVDTLRLEDSGFATAQDLLGAMALRPGSPMPLILPDGRLQVAGATGTIVVQGQIIEFSNIEYIELGGYMYLEGRGG
ncbi:calcium-binding protein [Falsiroseomonas sp.]|uniref:calcium-binding protein n=1 Tax=Falsiroseomonas sp. TaxID=2870721 RepID=UPI003F6F38E4